MASNGAGASAFASEEEFARMQELSAKWAPEMSGPLVSERISTNAITAEYARADPVYQAKTASLPQRYSYYRTCRGDGHCGWRAVAFCYYETLLRMGDKQKFLQEQARIRSFANLLQAVGHPRDIYEDWEEEVLDLLRSLPNYGSIEEGEAALLLAFNETGPWQSIITHLKILTAAWIRTRPDKYEPYLQGQTLEEYVSRNVEASECEIDHLSLNALHEVLLNPAGIALEVLYLDRSAGTDLVRHRMDTVDPTTGMVITNAPTVRLLYRPGHYDILYSFEDLPAASNLMPQALNGSAPNGAPHTPVFVALASPAEDGPSTGLQATPYQQMEFAGHMPIIPGMSGISAPGISGTQSLWMSPPTAPTGVYPASSNYDFLPQSTGMMQREYQPIIQPVQSQPPPAPALQRMNSSHIEQHYSQSSPMVTADSYMTLPPPPIDSAEMYMQGILMVPQHHHSPTGPVAAPVVQLGGINRGRGPFRPSVWELDSRWGEAAMGSSTPSSRDAGFKTAQFRNSHFNTAHFTNPDFQPEAWTPDSEPIKERSRRKSTAH